MINLRYHIVSITAVFLALGIGLIFGAAFVDRATVGVLENNLDAIERQNDDLEALNARLDERIRAAEEEQRALLEQGLGQLVQARLDGVPVVVVSVEGVDADTVAAVADAVAASGAEVGGVLRFTERLVLDEEAEVTDLSTVLQLGTDDPVRLRASLARRLGGLLADAAQPAPGDPVPPAPEGDGGTAATATTTEPPATVVPEPELLVELRASGFLELDAPAEPPAQFAVLPAAGLRTVVVSGPGAVLADAELLVPLIAELSEDAVPQVGGPVVVAAQRGPDAGAAPTDGADPDAERVAFVGLLRSAESLRDRVSTVDTLERFTGLLATVLALQYGAEGQFGHYGVGEGAQGLLPPAPAGDGG